MGILSRDRQGRPIAGRRVRMVAPSACACVAGALLLLPAAAPAYPPSLGKETIPADMPSAVRTLAEQLYDEGDARSAAAAKALGEMGPAAVSAAPYLASMLDGHFAVDGPNYAAQALVKIGKGAFEAASAAAVSATGEDARRRATIVMGRIDGERAAPVVLELLTARPVMTGYEWGCLRMGGEAARAQVLRALEANDPAVRRSAVRALPAFSTLRVGFRDINSYGADDRGGPRWCRTQPVVDLLLKAVGDADAEVRAAALASLAEVSSCRDKKMPLGDTLRAALKDAAAAVRLAAVGVAMVADETDKVKFDALAPLTGDADPGVRVAAAAALGSLAGERSAVVPLLVKLLRDPAAGIREGAAMALGGLRAAEAEESLLAALKDEARPVQIAAARTLGTTAGRSGVDALAALAKGPADQALRLEAVRALAAIYLGYCGNAAGRSGVRKPTAASFRPEDAAGAEVIFQTLSQTLADPMSDLHAPSIQALARTPAGAGKELVPLLVLAMRSPEEAPRIFVVRSFLRGSDIRDDRLLGAIHEHVLHGTGETEYSCGLLAHWGDSRSIPVFKKVLLTGRVKTGGAIGGLIAAGGPSLDFVLENLGNAKTHVRENVAAVLAQHIAEPKVMDFVRAALSSPNEDLRAGARRVAALAPQVARAAQTPEDRLRSAILSGYDVVDKYGQRKPDPALARSAAALLDDPSDTVRAAAAEALGAFGDAGAAGALRKALADKSALVRAAAAGAIGQLGDRTCVPAAIAALDDGDEAVREAAAAALGRLGDPSAAGALAKALDGSDWRLRRAAAQGLGAFGDANTAAALRKALATDPHWCVRGAAAGALGRAAGASGEAALTAALADGHWYVRQSARAALAAATAKQSLPPDGAAWRARQQRQGAAPPRPADGRRGRG
jgi:HEAT repeat protein